MTTQPTNDPKLPVVGNVAVYARAATPARPKEAKSTTQTDDLFHLARSLGYEDTHITLCQDHHALVITPEQTYDFHDPIHVKLFRFKCEPGHGVLENIQAN